MKGQPTKDVTQLIHEIKVGNVEGSYNITTKTLKLFKKIINGLEWAHADELMNIVRTQGHILQSAMPQETVTANIARRILKLIREEFDLLQAKVHQFTDDQASMSLHKLVTQTSNDVSVDYTEPQQGLREALLDHLQEIETELETSSENICAQAEEHIHSSEVILTLGHSRSVENFLKRAVKKRQFLTIIIAECAPDCRGHNLAASLANGNAEIIVIPDSAIFAMMSRVNKVIIGTHSVLANGGLRAACGSYTVALSAKHYSVPVIVLSPMYKLSPVHLCSLEQDAFNLVGCAEDVIGYDSLASHSAKVYSPIFDYVPPELVTLFISNIGGHAPSYVYRLLTELYNPEDYEI
ncbi:PREDICTED: translation initiation factor eIF-2B subunit beta [Rhagoletis zephyria]|uniref:translation initiation factor eIF-2B subunit beta n=1 Tax=Rhagoletis zephyria TaxID=28612 RepID=UPI0008116E14|nr:PREDICTED: translation initiation factor eIF-2B subunit beta [Rhagoletis zephyria]